jgi:hypothetical protein
MHTQQAPSGQLTTAGGRIATSEGHRQHAQLPDASCHPLVARGHDIRLDRSVGRGRGVAGGDRALVEDPEGPIGVVAWPRVSLSLSANIRLNMLNKRCDHMYL